MTKEHTEFLYNQYPNLYQQHKLPKTKTLMCWGFEVEDGWFDIINELSAQLEPIGVEAVQVKEKYGTLRFYVSFYTDEIMKYILDAEEKSAVTCEICGKPGTLQPGSWLKTLCDKHAR